MGQIAMIDNILELIIISVLLLMIFIPLTHIAVWLWNVTMLCIAHIIVILIGAYAYISVGFDKKRNSSPKGEKS